MAVNVDFLEWSPYFFILVAPLLFSQDEVSSIPDPLQLRKYGSARNLIHDLWFCGQEI
jgi:hypothetical protein